MRKTKSFSHIAAQDALEQLNESRLSDDELVYHLLRIFCGYGDGSIRRIREGVGNKAKDGRTILIPNLIAYRPKGELDLHEEIESMQSDPKITKHSPRLYVVSDGRMIVANDPKEQDIYENEVALMWKDFEFFYPLAGIEKFRNIEEADADVKSAELMAKIFDEIRRHNNVKDPAEMHLSMSLCRVCCSVFLPKIPTCSPKRICLPTPFANIPTRTGTTLRNLSTAHFWRCPPKTRRCWTRCRMSIRSSPM